MIRTALAIGFAVLAALPSVALAQHDAHWSYEGHSGPAHWAALNPEFAACGSGTAQSPVDIPADAPPSTGRIAFDYRPGAVSIHNNGHTVQADHEQGSSITVDGTTFDLIQLHFHAHSEHAIGGRHEPMELHLVHRSATGRLAVVGILLRQGAPSVAYKPLLANLPREVGGGAAATVSGTIDPGALLPADRSHWRYAGSLTTPPCTEGVTWLLMTTPVELSDKQIAAFTSIYDADARPVQPLNGRSFDSGSPARD